MATRRHFLWLSLLALLMCFLAPPGIRAQSTGDGRVGSEMCAGCHDEVAAEFALTGHATAKGWDAESGCESCHGPGEAHVESGDLADIRRFPDLSRRDASAVCLECHGNTHPSMRIGDGIHRRGDIGCTDCHDPHSRTDKMVPRNRVELCSRCHPSVVAQFDLPIHHPLGTAGKGCATCHDPHGVAITSNRVHNLGLNGGVCADCHRDKVGPFVFPHDVSIVDGCRACHEMHGSPNRHLLTATRQITLCFQCHPDPMGPHSPSNLVNQKCTTCHVDIHGSNTNSSFWEN
jgi:DmsE family decaheme c-type cytochrome